MAPTYAVPGFFNCTVIFLAKLQSVVATELEHRMTDASSISKQNIFVLDNRSLAQDRLECQVIISFH